MKDGFEETFVVELAADAVWETIASRTTQRDADADGDVHYVLPGFPSFVPQKVSGASGTLVELDPGRLLRVRKDDEPCAGTEIAVTLEDMADLVEQDLVLRGSKTVVAVFDEIDPCRIAISRHDRD